MLFAVIYRWKPSTSEQDARRMRQLFIAWTPPPALEIKTHFAFAGGGGVAIISAEAPATLRETIAPFLAHLDFEIQPALSVPEAIAVELDVDRWADSVEATS